MPGVADSLSPRFYHVGTNTAEVREKRSGAAPSITISEDPADVEPAEVDTDEADRSCPLVRATAGNLGKFDNAIAIPPGAFSIGTEFVFGNKSHRGITRVRLQATNQLQCGRNVKA